MKINGILPNCVEYARAQEEIERRWKEKHTNGEKKMRLIDADEVYGKRFTVVDVIEGVPVHRNVVKAFDVKEAPTVNAIPIEWIKDWRKEKWFDSKLSMEERTVRAMVARMIVEDWEKENETD